MSRNVFATSADGLERGFVTINRELHGGLSVNVLEKGADGRAAAQAMVILSRAESRRMALALLSHLTQEIDAADAQMLGPQASAGQ